MLDFLSAPTGAVWRSLARSGEGDEERLCAGAARDLAQQPRDGEVTRFMNLPNSITISRIATIPLLIWILSPAFPANHATHGLLGGEQEILASAVFIVADRKST